MAAAVDWSQLPAELLHLVSERLDSPLHLLRFRSVCSAWRSSSPPTTIPNLHVPITFPPLSDLNPASTSSASKLALLLITPPPHPHHQTQTPWLVKISQNPTTGRIRLYHPLFHDLRLLCPSLRVLDLYHLRIFHLRNEFCTSCNNFYMDKVVAATTSPGSLQLLMTGFFGNLALFRSGDDRWTDIADMRDSYCGLCIFNGRPCAVGRNGRTIAVRPDSSVELLAEPGFEGGVKFLVESGGELLLVNKNEGVVNFDVFRLDRKEKRWVKMTSLGDRVLFLGDDCTFSCYASDLRLGRGNCVVFRDRSVKCEIGVFQLDVGRVSPLSDHPDYSRLFWPQPDLVRLHCH